RLHYLRLLHQTGDSAFHHGISTSSNCKSIQKCHAQEAMASRMFPILPRPSASSSATTGPSTRRNREISRKELNSSSQKSRVFTQWTNPDSIGVSRREYWNMRGHHDIHTESFVFASCEPFYMAIADDNSLSLPPSPSRPAHRNRSQPGLGELEPDECCRKSSHL
ncbi:MAG: hypothetical protein LBI59_00535, partial [Candidatus Accumulibacter sp.]|nr:hypothetical protein [Accumulibacter sp.]